MVEVKVKRLEGKVKEVEVREPTVKDLIKAMKMAKVGNRVDEERLIVALAHLCTTFDGKKLTMEEIENLPLSFFSPVLKVISSFLPQKESSEGQSSSSQNPQIQA